MTGAEIWQHVNDSLKIALWPGVIAWVLFVLRHKIKDRMGDLESVESPALTARFRGRELAVRSAVEGILEASNQGQSAAGEVNERDESATNLLDVREDIEDVIRQSFMLGVEAGARSPVNALDVEPVVVWTGAKPSVGYRTSGRAATLAAFEAGSEAAKHDNALRTFRRRTDRTDIVMEGVRRTLARAGFGDPPVDVPEEQFDRAVEINRLETEIERLLFSLASFDDPHSSDHTTERNLLFQLHRRLKRLDPLSPLAKLDLTLELTGLHMDLMRGN
jgi:hypothetical protein